MESNKPEGFFTERSWESGFVKMIHARLAGKVLNFQTIKIIPKDVVTNLCGAVMVKWKDSDEEKYACAYPYGRSIEDDIFELKYAQRRKEKITIVIVIPDDTRDPVYLYSVGTQI